MKGIDDRIAEVSEAFCRPEAYECRAVNSAWVPGKFGRGVVCSGYGGDLLKEAGAEVFQEVGGDEYVRVRGGPRGLAACRLARRSRPTGAGELAGRVRRNL